MKKILLASVALTAFAGAAAAEVSFSGDAELGYNDNATINGGDGFYWTFGLKVGASQELDNGLTAAISADVVFTDGDTFSGGAVSADDLVLSLTSANAGLYFGDVDNAADATWTGVTNMEADSFAEAGDLAEDAVLRGEVSYGSVDLAVSYNLMDATDTLDNLQVGASADLGMATVTAVYQDDTATGNEVLGLTGAGTFGGADVTVSYADNGAETSMGVQVAYAMGAVTATVFYVSNDVADDNYGLALAYAEGPLSVSAWVHEGNDEDQGINVAYDMGNGLALYAGDSEDDGTYVGAEYDLGGGAALLVSYGEDDVTPNNDEIGPQEYNAGTTVAVSFAF
ncbi:MAG: porin [Marivivens sp.]|jgi:hypothetical protein|nr:porin [Marivivens sp.]